MQVRYKTGDLVTFKTEYRAFPTKHKLGKMHMDIVWRVIGDDRDDRQGIDKIVYYLVPMGRRRLTGGRGHLEAFGYRLENSFLAKVAEACEKGKRAAKS